MKNKLSRTLSCLIPLKRLKRSFLENFQKNKNPDNETLPRYCLDRYRNLFKDHGYEISLNKNIVCISGDDLKIIGDSLNTFSTGECVLCKGEYEFCSNEDFIMIDIGLNIGIAALSMARKENILKIYGYEPFLPTFKQAAKNLEINHYLKNKIEIFNFGLGNEDKNLAFNYNPQLPGSMSSIKNRFPDCKQIEHIEIKKASSVIYPVISKHKEKIFLKIDCEGAEDEILKDLDNEGLLRRIDIICMEWHFKSPDNLIDILKNNNFIVFSEEIIKNELGFIRAVNRKQ